jgi:hypothetical protein
MCNECLHPIQPLCSYVILYTCLMSLFNKVFNFKNTHVAGKIWIQDADINTNNVHWTSLLKNWIPVIAGNARHVKKVEIGC